MNDLTKGQKAYLITHSILSAIGLVLILFLLDIANLKVFGTVLTLIFYVAFVASIFFIVKKKWYVKCAATLLLVILTMVMFFAAAPGKAYLDAVQGKNLESTAILEVEGGKIQGVKTQDGKVEVYAGIPYAKAPIGDLRWKEPQNVEPWEGVKDCTKFANRAMQSSTSFMMNTLQDMYLEGGWHIDLKYQPDLPMSEDCLYLNVYKPVDATENTPVLIYYHGGSLMSGTTASKDIYGVEVAKKGVIFVTVAYRLGVFGYLALPELKEESPNGTTGNYGLLDQVKALEWVNNNITKFNGDKTNITIAGESAGSSSISALCSTPLAKNLFKQAIGESSSVVLQVPPHTFRTLDKAYKMGADIKKEFGVETLEQMRAMPAEELIKTKYENSAMTVDGYALPKTPYEIYLAGENNEKALLNGVNAGEADPFIFLQYLFGKQPNLDNYKERLQSVFGEDTDALLAMYEGKINSNKDASKVFNEIISAYWFIYPHQSWSTMAYNNSEKVYRYVFTKENGYMSTWHSGEIIYAYGNVKNEGKSYRYDESDLALSDTMLNYWINFVKTGNPNGENLPQWDEWNPINNRIIELGSKVDMIDDPYQFLYDFMKAFDEKRAVDPNNAFN
ncbi:MAG: carboxylesterase family protein [Clostridiales bacterium]|nr:carboxylesterase family protein [Clostridiales bacterium]